MDGEDKTCITVIICTRNRGASLHHTLDSLLTPSNLARHDWELIVVDNGSTDDTKRIATEVAAEFPSHVRALAEPKRGLSNARNRGVRAARGEILAFTDDDCVCEDGYLAGIREVLGYTEVEVAVGRTLLVLDGKRPVWLNTDLARCLCDADFGTELHELPYSEAERFLYGCNMVVRRPVFAKIGGFRPDLGAGATGFCEDTEFGTRALGAGYRIFYVPQIMVRHHPSTGRLKRRMFFGRFFRQGLSEAHFIDYTRLNPAWNPATPGWRYRIYYAKKTVLECGRALRLHFAGQPEEAMKVALRAFQAAGSFSEYARLRRMGINQAQMPEVVKDETQPAPPCEASSNTL